MVFRYSLKAHIRNALRSCLHFFDDRILGGQVLLLFQLTLPVMLPKSKMVLVNYKACVVVPVCVIERAEYRA